MKTPLVILVALALASAGFASESNPPVRSITTSGIAEREYAPDRAHLFIEIKAVTKTFDASAALVDAAHATLAAEMKQLGIAAADVGVRFRTMEREYEWRREVRVPKGQACHERVEVVVRDLTQMGPALEALTSIPHLELDGIDYRSSREGEMKREALLLATRAAREKAEAVAGESAVKLAGLLEFEEVSSADVSGGRAAWNVMANTVVAQTSVADPGAGAAARTVRVAVRAKYAIE